MMRPHMLDPIVFEPITTGGPPSFPGWVRDARRVSDEDLFRICTFRRDGEANSEGELFLEKAHGLGVNVGGLYRDVIAARFATGGYAQPFDACTWPQALEYAGKALPSGTEAQRYEWAIRYMWCLEIEEPPLPPEAVLARALMGEASMPKASPSEPQ